MKWLLLLLGLIPCYAKMTVGSFFSDNTQWALLDTFYFDEQGGYLRVEDIMMDTRFPNQELALYHDDPGTPGAYATLHASSASCEYKLLQSAKVLDLNHTKLQYDEETEDYLFFNFKTTMARKWHIVLANCDVGEVGPLGSEGVGLMNYKFTWLNGINEHGTKFTYQFSKDETGIFEMMIASLLFLVILIGTCGAFYYKLRQDDTDLAHKVLFAVLVTMSVHLLSVILQLAHRNSYSKNGVGLPEAQAASLVLDNVTQLLMVALFISIAKGLYISSEHLRDVRTILEIMALYFIATVFLLYWSYNLQNVALDEYAYATWAGKCITWLRVITIFWFLSSLRTTFRRERKDFKRNFYLLFGLFGVAHLAVVPISAAVATNSRAYNRVKAIVLFEQIAMLATYTVWIVLFCVKRDYVRKTDNSMEGHGQLQQEDFTDIGHHQQTDSGSEQWGGKETEI